MINVKEIKVKRLIGWGGSIADAVQKAGDDIAVVVRERAEAACLRKLGSDFAGKVEFVFTDNARYLIIKETKEEVIRFTPLMHNSYEDMVKTQKVVMSVQYVAWDGKE